MGEKKRILQKIESITKAIEEHLNKIEEEFKKNDRRYTFYYFKEILGSMFFSLKEQYQRLDQEKQGEEIIQELLEKLEKILKSNSCYEEYKEIYLKRFGSYP